MDTQYQGHNNNHHYQPQTDDFNKNDLQMGLNSPEQIHQMMRLGFIKKVYGILALQLTITACLIAIAFIPSVNHYMGNNLTLFWVSLALSLIILIPLVCVRSIGRKVPLNYILLVLWTLCESYMVATVASFYEPKVVFTAAAMTAAVTIALTIYACTTKTDFTYCGGLLFCFAALMLTYTIFAICFQIYLGALYCVFGVLLYSVYLIYDTQLIMGKFGNEYNVDDYVFAAISIYLDIIQIFLYILRMLGRN
jgi:FtsH-binding integral membrane protein